MLERREKSFSCVVLLLMKKFQFERIQTHSKPTSHNFDKYDVFHQCASLVFCPFNCYHFASSHNYSCCSQYFHCMFVERSMKVNRKKHGQIKQFPTSTVKIKPGISKRHGKMWPICTKYMAIKLT